MGEEDATVGLAGRNVGGWVQGAKAPKHQMSEGQHEQLSSLEWVLGCRFLRRRTVDTLARHLLTQYYEGITDLLIGAPNRDVVLITQARCESIC